MNFDIKNMTDEEFQELLYIGNKAKSIEDKNIRKRVLSAMIYDYLEDHKIEDLVKIITDCVPTGYVARIIINLRDR